MWEVKYKPNNDNQAWLIFGSYENKTQAYIRASRVSGEYFMVEVIDPDGSVAWSHYN